MSHYKLNLSLAVPSVAVMPRQETPITNCGIETGEGLLVVDRRTTLKWIGAVVLAANTELASPATKLVPTARGYGGDPNLTQPVVPWSRTLTKEQLLIIAGLCDVLLPDDGRSPAASAVGVHDFVDEWVSAPYPEQKEDRATILSGIDWVKTQTAQRTSQPFHQVPKALQIELFEKLGTLQKPDAGSGDVGAFLPRLRYIAIGAYYTSEAGIADLGHIGNKPMVGDYPGPTAEALEHLHQTLKRLGLSL